MYSGIIEKSKKIKTMSQDDKQDLKEMVIANHKTIRNYLAENDVPYAVLTALEDRLIQLSEISSKL
jgi:formyltetrahydrofolate hydrolase